MRWEWQIITLSILEWRHCATVQRLCLVKKSSRLVLDQETTTRGGRAFSRLGATRKSRSWLSAMLVLLRHRKSLQHPSARASARRSPPLVRKPVLSFAWSTGELKTARISLTNNANSPAGSLIVES